MKKIIMLIMFLIIMISMGTYVFINKDELFITKIEIKYPDNCIEIFEGNELVTPECTEGRQIVEMQKNGTYQPENYNPGNQWKISPINLT